MLNSRLLVLFVAITTFWQTSSALVAQSIVRGPYLQIGTPSQITIRWRTDRPSPSIIHYGKQSTVLSQRSHAEAPVTDHEVTISGLKPKTRYYYAVYTAQGPSTTASFVTSPLDDTTPFKAWVLGDPGISGKLEKGEDPGQAAVRDSFLKAVPLESLSFILMLGDNTYYTGTDIEYQRGVFDFYAPALRSLVTWPTQGNHDNTDKAYYQVFTLPQHGEAGGVASSTEAFYSFDFSNTHFVILNSEISDAPFRSRMVDWLRKDLAANRKTWTVALYHHPSYSKGTHDADDVAKEGTKMVWMRENINPILEQAGVDLVLSGHSHNYERSMFIDGFYGNANTFSATNIKQEGSGNPLEGKPYKKHSRISAPHSGTVYVVAGNAGFVEECPLGHPAMIESHYRLGSLLLEADSNNLTVSLYGITGQVEDHFALTKQGAR